jgi:hypothetical protein
MTRQLRKRADARPLERRAHPLYWGPYHAAEHPMAAEPDDDFDLGISLESVATIAGHARALQGREEGAEAYAAEDDADHVAPHVAEDALRAFIADLNEDEQASLIALAWVGRGDYEAGEWDEARALAAERNQGRDAADYLLSMDNLGDLLAEGAAAFGFNLEDYTE